MKKNIFNLGVWALCILLFISCAPDVVTQVEEVLPPSDKEPVGEEQVVKGTIRMMDSFLDINSYSKIEAKDNYSLKLVRNEFESFQIAIETVDNRPLKVSIDTPESGLQVNLYTICSYGKEDEVLVPSDGQVRPDKHLLKIWANVYASRELKPGQHVAKIVLSNGHHRYEFSITADVANAILPETPLMPSVFAIEPDLLVASADKSATSRRRMETAELLLQRRISPFFCKWHTGTVHCSSSPYEYGESGFWNYLKDPRFSRIALPSQTLNDEDLQKMLSEASENGLLEKSYFYVWDEPRMEKHYSELRDYASRIHRYSPKAKVLTTFFGGSEDGPYKNDFYAVFDFLKGTTSIFCTSVWALGNSESSADKCRSKLAESEEWWSYVCMGTVPGLSYTSTAIENRVVMWRNWKEQNTGFLYWAVNSYASIFPMRSRPELPAGDGVLVYPGEPYGYDGICSSIRLEHWRDGAEDCDMLMMIEQNKGRKTALDILSKVYTSPTKYKQSIDDINAFREMLIENL